MSTRGGLPTAAIYVFVNMIKKLRQDFAPIYFAAVFDVSGAVFRDERARTMGPLRKWDSKTQAFLDVTYEGYKANRASMPEDLGRQIPYIRRALDALRIPILEAIGFEADDVIGTLAREAAERGHEVFIVSGDKDMMQLVTPHVKILNPQKDNLILDPAKVVEVLGVPPEKVVDVMALRGDSVDNIPGAPGIGDKGSVDLILEFGSVEAVLDRAAEVKRKSYRESLEQNRGAVLLSKELVTIDCHVPLALELSTMETQPPDIEACRELFTELEFTSMLKELAPATGGVVVELIDEPTAEQAAQFYASARERGFALSLNAAALVPLEQEDEEVPQTMSLLDVAEAADKPASFSAGVCAEPGTALCLTLTPELRALLEDAAVPMFIHDWKTALHVLSDQGITLRGVVDDSMLLSYALNPTHATQTLADVAARHGQPAPSSLPAAASSVYALVPALKAEADNAQVTNVYRDIDLPLAPVLFSMERAGVRIDKAALGALSKRFSLELERVGESIFSLAGHRFNINSPKQLGVVLFTHLGLPAPVVRGKGKAISTAQDVLESLASQHEVPRLVLEYRHLSKLKSNYIDALPLLADSDSRVHTTFQAAATATGRLSSVNPNLQNIPIRTELGREIRAAFTASPGTQLLSADYSQIELRLLAHFSQDPRLCRRDRHPCPHCQRGFWSPHRNNGQGDAEPRQGRQLRHRLRHLGLRARRAVGHSPGRSQGVYREILHPLRRCEVIHRTNAGADAPRRRRAHPLRQDAAHSGYREPQPESARIRRTHRREYSIARHGGRPDQAGHDRDRPPTCRAQVEDKYGFTGARRVVVRSPARRNGRGW